MKKKTWLIAGLSVLAAGTLAVGLAGCSGGYKFEEYSYNQGGTSEKDWRLLEFPDTDMKVDGVVDEAAYGENFLSFSDVNGVNMKVHAHMGEEGVFFGFVSNDQNVNYNTNNAVFNNTSVEIQVAPFGTEKLNVNVIQLRLGANGTSEQWVGFKADDKAYNYTKKYIPSMGTVHVNGELNGTADGYSAELYLPYASIGLAEKPESVVCAPSFNTLPTRSDANRATWTMMLGCDLRDPATWYVVDDTGMTPHTAGFEERTGGILQTGGKTQVYYMDSVAQPAYYLKSSLSQTRFLNSDEWPKFGLVNKSDDAMQCFYVDASQGTDPVGTNFGTVHAQPTTNGGTDLMWDRNASSSMASHWANGYISGYKNIALETIYYGGDLYFVINGTLAKTVHGFAPTSEGAIPGFWCMNTELSYQQNEYVTDAAAVRAEAEKFIAKDKKIDGDLSDWTDETVNRHFISATDPNGNSMKVRAFRGTDGLYIAYNVHHLVNSPVSKWDDGWWFNTNIEFFVNGTTDKEHYALTTFGTSGYMDAVMTTVRDENREYDTVAEIFVPFASLKKDDYNEEDPLKVGFAFKTTHNNPTDADKLNGSEWWFIGGAPNDASRQHQVLAKGIGTAYTLTYDAGDGNGEAFTDEVFGGDVITLPGCPETFTYAGHRFLNWSDGETRYGAGDEYTMPDHAATLTAMWIDEGATGTWHVTYDKGTGEGITGEAPTDSNTYAPGEVVTLKDQGTLSYPGYRFMGWSDGETTYKAGGKANIGGSNLALTAVWAKEYTLTYSLGEDREGTPPESRQLIENEKVELPTPTRTGYDFYAWQDGSDPELHYDGGSEFTMPAEEVTLTAIWTKKITVDGSLAEWAEFENKTLGAHAPGESDKREATWYGVLRSDGLYLAAELWHNEATRSGDHDRWFNNFNFEIRLNDGENANHYYAYLVDGSVRFGRDSGPIDGVQYKYTHEAGTQKGTEHHSVFEVFIPIDFFRQLKKADGSVALGVALKTGDYEGGAERIPGGSVNYEGGDTWYAPYGVWPDNPSLFAYVSRDGMFLKEEHEHPEWKFGTESAADDDDSITIDGSLDDWATLHTIGITGTDTYAGKSVTIYGKLTKKGLYLAADAYHGVFTTGQGEWHMNTNFELRIGRNWGGDGNRMPKQFWVKATGTDSYSCEGSVAGMETALVHSSVSQQNATHHTIVEVFIPASLFAEYDYMIADGMLQVGVAWKTNGDGINNAQLGDGDAWWMPKGEHVNSNPACVDGTGIYLAGEYTRS